MKMKQNNLKMMNIKQIIFVCKKKKIDKKTSDIANLTCFIKLQPSLSVHKLKILSKDGIVILNDFINILRLNLNFR